ncbi:hypothetical protein IW261DRAFT_1345991, partial [Armillaria novae-zelandiae]
VKHELLEYVIGTSKDAIRWYELNLSYNVAGTNLNCSMTVVDTAEIIKISLMDDE